ncbi:MAG TPA: fused MFS/spermidine synthase [Bellilinea sp.]|nr:fused MFS/spermidine synthase [Bellilinea sp.]
MKKWIYAAAFTSGFASLATEMAASRLLGNYFGASNLVWSAIIGLILIYLTVGYFIGGRWADKSPRTDTFYTILAIAGFTTGLIPLVSRPILNYAANAFNEFQFGVLMGTFVSVLLLFILPVILMGTASPFAIRLLIQDTSDAGKTAGRVYAVSTLGSFLGAFVPTLLLIPWIGTFRSFAAIGLILNVIAIAALFFSRSIKRAVILVPSLLILLAILALGKQGFERPTAGLIYENESAYNYIQVIADGEDRYLKLNEGQGVHSVYTSEVMFYNGPWEQVLVAPYFNDRFIEPAEVRSMAIVGLAAGTTSRQAFSVYPNIRILGIEIDPVIIDVGNRYFDMDDTRLTTQVQDGRWALTKDDQKYQIISIDAYRPPYIPWHLTTKEFFEIVKEHLTVDGVAVINVGRSPDDRSLVNALAATAGSVFTSVHVVDLPQSLNSIVFATVQETSPENLIRNYAQIMNDEQFPLMLRKSMANAIENLQPEPVTGGYIFTDDDAPIERFTNRLVLNYFFSRGVQP